MTLASVIWSVWGAIVIVFAILKVYMGSLSRNESDQLVLEAGSEHLKTENDAILAQLGKAEHVSRIVKWVLIVATVGLVGYYIVDIIHQFQ